MDTNQILSIKKAAEELGITDVDGLRKSARKYGALILVGGGLEYIDLDRFNHGVEAEVKSKAEQAARRASGKATSGRQLGLLKARTERAPGLIMAKEATIVAARKQVEVAPNPYEQSRARKTVADLEASLSQQKKNFARDEAELNRLLNEPEE